MQDRTLTITTDKGEEITCQILFTHYSEEFKKHYVVFVEKGTNQASAACYEEIEGGNGDLKPIDTEQEWSMIEEVFEQYAKEHEDGCGCGCDDCHDGCDCCSDDSCDCCSDEECDCCSDEECDCCNE